MNAPEPPVSVRAAGSGDAESWTKLRAALWPSAERGALLDETRAFLDGFDRTLAAAFVAEDSRAGCIGFAELAIRPFSDGCDSMPVPHVEGWYVAPPFRARGIGRRLLRAAEDWARENGFKEIASDTEVDNDASLRAHQACGYEEVDRLIKFRKNLG